ALVVGGHKDIGATKCPGQFLEAQLPAIRTLATSMMGATVYDPVVSGPMPWGGADPLTVTTRSTAPISWNLAIASRCGTVVRTISGRQDAAGPLTISWDKRDGNGAPVPPGTYTFTLTGDANGDAVYPWTGSGVITPAAGAPQDPCGPPENFTLVGSGYGHGIGLSQWGAYAMAKEGRDASGILTYYYTGTTVSAVPDETELRVNVRYQIANAQMRSEAIAADGGAIEVNVGGNVVVAGPQDVFTFGVSGASVAVQRVTQGQTTDLAVPQMSVCAGLAHATQVVPLADPHCSISSAVRAPSIHPDIGIATARWRSLRSPQVPVCVSTWSMWCDCTMSTCTVSPR
ncbi:MAG: FlgD immunoglobulin-like domain containing protein, partial [Actinomycetales bacterium]